MRLISKGPGCMVMIEVDRPSGLLARSGSGSMIQLALYNYMLYVVVGWEIGDRRLDREEGKSDRSNKDM